MELLKYNLLFFNSEQSEFDSETAQRAFTCPKLTIETLEQSVKYGQS